MSGLIDRLLGYLAGNSYAAVERAFGRTAGTVIAALVVVGLLLWFLRRRRREMTRPRRD